MISGDMKDDKTTDAQRMLVHSLQDQLGIKRSCPQRKDMAATLISNLLSRVKPKVTSDDGDDYYYDHDYFGDPWDYHWGF